MGKSEARYLTLPTRINGEAPVLEIAFSEVQWSWHTVCRMGGLAPDDIRYLPDLAVHEPWQGISADEALRAQRCQRIDLAAYDDSWDIHTLPDRFLSAAVPVHNHCQQHADSEHASDTDLNPKDVTCGIAYLGLHDSLAITREIAEDYHILLALEDTLQAVECYLRVPESGVRGGFGYVEVQTQMDLNGDGQLLLPDSGVASESVWRWSEQGFSNIRWDNIEQTTPGPTAQPREF